MNKPLSEKTTRLHNTASLIAFLQHFPPFNQMDESNLGYLIENSELAFYAKGNVIIAPQKGQVETLFIIKKGNVHGERTDAPNEETYVAISLSEGECFPLAAIIGERSTRTCYRAAEDTFCFQINKSVFKDVFTRSRAFRDFALRGISSLLDQANEAMKASASGSLNEGYSLDTPLAEFTRKNPIVCQPDTPINKAVETMHAHNIGSMVATDDQRVPVGIFTLRDLRKVVAQGKVSLTQPISQVMTAFPKTLPSSATAFDAALLMASHHFSHVCLVDETGGLTGVVSQRDIFSLQRVNLVHLARSLDNAPSFAALKGIREEVPGLINNMLAHGASVFQINRMTTLLNDYTVSRTLTLVSRKFHDDLPPFTWLSFGSEARMEQTLVTDQDNGILYEPDEANEEQEKVRLLAFAKQVNEQLDYIGFPLCKGNIMASNPDLCLTLTQWKNKFSSLVQSATPKNLLQSNILFDLRAVHGNKKPVEELQAHFLKTAQNNSLFLKMLATTALQNRPPLTILHRFKTQKHGDEKTIDLKVQGVSPFIEGIRILALANSIPATNTLERLAALTHKNVVNQKDAAAWNEAYSFIQNTRMKHHYDQFKHNRPQDNRVDPSTLNLLDQRVLKEAFRQAQRLQKKLEIKYQL